MKRRTMVRLGILTGALVLLGSIGGWQMAKMLDRFQGRRPVLDAMTEVPSGVGLTYVSFHALNPDGTRIAGWWLPARSPVATIVMIHGFHQNKSAMLERAATLVANGFNVALIDLRARGESGGDRADIGPGAAYDVLAALEGIRARQWLGDLPVVGYGFSHGARAVLFAAVQSRDSFAAVIAEAPPFSLREGLRRQTRLPWVPSLPEGDLQATFAALRDRPILLLYGDKDPDLTSIQAGSLVSNNRHGATSTHEFLNSGHGVFADRSRVEYLNVIAGFVARATAR